VQSAHDPALAVEASARRYNGLFDRRPQVPSPKRAPVDEIQRVLALYRDRYQGLKVRHFHQLVRRQHDVRFCYAFVRKALQTAGLVAKHRPRVARRGESVTAIMTALRAVLEQHGLPMALYTDRAHWAAHTRTAGAPVDRQHPTQVGPALAVSASSTS
jgi:hypothetical protein